MSGLWRDLDPMLWCAVFGAAWSNYPCEDGDVDTPEKAKRWDDARLFAATNEADAAVEALHDP